MESYPPEVSFDPLDRANIYPGDPQIRRFIEIFHEGWDFIESWVEPFRWHTETRYYLKPLIFWKKYRDPNVVLGIRFKEKTKYGLYDVDIESSYNPYNHEEIFRMLQGAFESYGFARSQIVRSSHSEGLHVYLPLPEEVSTFDLACLMKQIAVTHGFKVSQGQLELFPNTKRYAREGEGIVLYQGHRLPLQQGSILLNDGLEPYSDSLEDFLSAFDMCAQAQDMERIREGLAGAREWYRSYRRREEGARAPGRSVAAWEEDSQAIITQGWTGRGQTNGLLMEMAMYGRIFMGLSGEELTHYIAMTAQMAPGYEEYCGHKHEIRERARHWGKFAEKAWKPLYSHPKREKEFREMLVEAIAVADNITNSVRAESATGRIKEAAKYIQEQLGGFVRTVKGRIKQLKEATKTLYGLVVGESTLRREENLPLWHPKHMEEAAPVEEEQEPQEESESESEEEEEARKKEREWEEMAKEVGEYLAAYTETEELQREMEKEVRSETEVEEEEEETTEERQPESIQGEECKKGTRPPNVIREGEGREEEPRSIQGEGYGDRHQTPRYNEGCMKPDRPFGVDGLNEVEDTS